MDEIISIKKSVLIELIWDICRVDQGGDIYDSAASLIKAIDINKEACCDALLCDNTTVEISAAKKAITEHEELIKKLMAKDAWV